VFVSPQANLSKLVQLPQELGGTPGLRHPGAHSEQNST
jgi:hypothetical protein